MQVKLKSNMFGKNKGDIIDVSKAEGERLIKQGDAIKPRASRKKISNKAMSAKTE